MVIVCWIIALMVMLLVWMGIKASDQMNGLIIGSVERFEDMDELIEMVSPSFLQQLNASVKLWHKSQHIVLQSSKVAYCELSGIITVASIL